MILVADSGSSKTNWLLDNPGSEPLAYNTDGLNPYFLSEKEILKKLQDQLHGLLAVASQVTEIYFFGAGCSSPDRHEIVSNALSAIFTKAYISVDSDLLGSAYATCGHHKGICCILGTGSNISYFDGENVTEGKHGLGFVLGDEGSGSWLGKKLVTDYLYETMPADLRAEFGEAYQVDKETVITNVYQQAGGNIYLASFTRFLSRVRQTDYAQTLLAEAFAEFVETNIKSYSEYRQHDVHFVGSIAYHFSDELRAVCTKNHIKVGKIIPKPIYELLKFILQRNSAEL